MSQRQSDQALADDDKDEVGPPEAQPGVSGTPDQKAASPKSNTAAPAPAAQTEQQKRDQEAADWERINFLNAYSYKEISAGKWIKERETEEERAALATDSNNKLKTEGIYTLKDHEKSIRIVLRKDEKDGSFSVSPYNPPKNGKEFKKVYGAAMDLLAAGRGASTINVNFDEKMDWNKNKGTRDAALKNLEKLIRMAEKRGLALNLKPGAGALLNSLPMNDPRRVKIESKLSELSKNQKSNELVSGKNLAALRNITTDLKGQVKLDEAGKKSITDLVDDDKKIDAIGKQLEEFNKRLQVLEEAKEKLEKGVKEANTLLNKPELPTEVARVTVTNRGSKDQGKYDTVEERIAAIADRNTEVMKGLSAAIVAEQKDLEDRKIFLQGELDAVKSKASAAQPAAGTSSAPTTENAPASEDQEKKKSEALAKQAEKIEGLEEKIKTQEPKLDAVKNLDDIKKAEKALEERGKALRERANEVKPSNKNMP